jgi:hypothetical protein
MGAKRRLCAVHPGRQAAAHRLPVMSMFAGTSKNQGFGSNPYDRKKISY